MLLLASVAGFFKGLLMLVFILSALLLMLVVLLQEPKGGGLSSAFGGAGAETFGVQAGSVNKFTAWVAGIFMATALLYATFQPDEGSLPSRAGMSEPTNAGKQNPGDESGAPANQNPGNQGNAPGGKGK